MITIIAGSRTIRNEQLVYDAIKESGFEITEVVSGHAQGVDMIGEAYTQEFGVKLKVFEADWDKLGNSAGIIRNQMMVDYADALIAVWDGKSKGTSHIIKQAKKKKLKVFVKVVEE